MSDIQEYTCPDCGQIGAHGKDSRAPLCDRCDYKVTMRKSQNGKILESPFDPEWPPHVEEIIEQYFERNPEKRKH